MGCLDDRSRERTHFGEGQLSQELNQFSEFSVKKSDGRLQPEAGTRFWPQILCFRGKIRSFYLFEGMGSFSLGGLRLIGLHDNGCPLMMLVSVLSVPLDRMTPSSFQRSGFPDNS